MKQRKRKGRPGIAWLILLTVLLAVLMMGAAAYLLLFGYNRFQLELELLEGDPYTLEYGAHYEEPGCRVLLRGSVFYPSGIELNVPVDISGTVHEDTLGQYPLHYHASCLGLEASETRLVRVVDSVSPVITLVPDEPGLKAASPPGIITTATSQLRLFAPKGRVASTISLWIPPAILLLCSGIFRFMMSIRRN